MELSKIIGELRQELVRIDEAIAALERLSTPNAKRRGRPPKWLKGAESEPEPEPASEQPKPTLAERPRSKAKTA